MSVVGEEPTAPLGTVHPVPRLSAGLRLHGEYQGSGFTEPRYIARRGDGQVIQLSRLLYLVSTAIDGVRDLEMVSFRVSAEYGRELSPENIAYLIEHKLEPLGVTAPPGQPDGEVAAPKSDLLLALKFHRVLFRENAVARIAAALAWLHRPLMVVLVLAGFAGLDVWLFGYYGAMTPVLHTLDEPVWLLAVFGLTVASLVFHEFGHASACRYGGAQPGCIGCGIFLVWPSLYTDVTDVYRIGRGGRVRTDLGGVYFNLVFMLGLAGVFLLTGQPFLLGAVYLGHFEVLEQLMPAIRLDGYYILGDLAGIPDLYGKIRPILLSMVPGRPTPPEIAGLKRSARTTVTVWVLTMVPLLVGDLGYALWNLPRIITTGVRSLTAQLAGTAQAFADGQIALGGTGLIGCLMLICPLVGMSYLSVRMAGRLARAAIAATEGNRRLRAAIAGVAVCGVAALGGAWAIGATPKPLPPQPPVVPVLQPNVPTASPSPHPSGRPHRHSGTPRISASPTGGPVPVTPTAAAAASPTAAHPTPSAKAAAPKPSTAPTSAPSASASPSPAASPTPAVTPKATTSASPTPSVSASPPPVSASPSPSHT